MSEQEDQFRDKLRREGKMPAFKTRVKGLRNAGASKLESWHTTAREFGYEPKKTPPEDDGDDDEDDSADAPEYYDTREQNSNAFPVPGTPHPHLASTHLPPEIQFALNNMHRIGNPYQPHTWKVQPQEAPSAAAWNMLMLAVGNKTHFMRMVFSELTAAQKVVEEQKTNRRHEKESGRKLEEGSNLWDMFRSQGPDALVCPACSARIVLPYPGYVRRIEEPSKPYVLPPPDELDEEPKLHWQWGKPESDEEKAKAAQVPTNFRWWKDMATTNSNATTAASGENT